MKYKDYYEVLGLPRTVTQDEVRRACRKLQRKYHPDVSQQADGEVSGARGSGGTCALPVQGGAGLGHGPAGDLHLEIAFREDRGMKPRHGRPAG